MKKKLALLLCAVMAITGMSGSLLAGELQDAEQITETIGADEEKQPELTALSGNETDTATDNVVKAVNAWDGTVDTSWYDNSKSEFELSAPSQLAGLAQLVNAGNTFEGKKVNLVNDIFLNDESYQHQWTPIACSGQVFQGTFNGNKHTIYNMSIEDMDAEGGLFGHIGDKGAVKSVDISQGYLCSGGCIADTNEGMISFCNNYSYVEGDDVGGICNWNDNLVYGCKNFGEVWGYWSGGIVGANMRSLAVVSQCSNHGIVRGSHSVAGIIYSNQGWVYNCYNTGVVDGLGDSAWNLAGIATLNMVGVINCYSVGTFCYSEQGQGIFQKVYPVCAENGDYQKRVTNCYSLPLPVFQKDEANIISYEEFQSPDFLNKLDQQIYSVFSAWVEDVNQINGGLPITVADYNYEMGLCKIQPEAWDVPKSMQVRLGGYGKVIFECYYNDTDPIVTAENPEIAEVSYQSGKGMIVIPKKVGETLVNVHFEETENNCSADYQFPLVVINPDNESSSGNQTNDTSDDKDDASDNKDDASSDKPVKVKKLSISAASKKIAAGKKIALSLAVSPQNATNPNVKWTTSNKNFATVNSKGVVTTKKAGKGKTVTITASSTDGSGKKATIKLTLMKNAVTKVQIKNAPKTLKAGNSITLKTTIKTNGKKANTTLQWTTSNKKYATVNSKGKVTAKKAGKGKTVTITAMSTDGSNKKAKVKIKIK